ncbi:MAG: uroporphyrinogen decarboxylase family protein [Thomasclavelia sp.]|nr:uroporphyrinogen decarboxylase family protein [Thomasclavelia sp.]
MNLNQWLKEVRKKENKKAMPILSFPIIQKMDITVKDLVTSDKLQTSSMELLNKECDLLAVLGLMDLSVEAECFGANVRFEDDEVPNIIGHIIEDNEQANNLKIPQVGTKRSGLYIKALKNAKKVITDKPVFAGCIGPFSLAGRLLDVSEAMILCYEEPEMVHIVLDKVTKFIIEYLKAYKEAGLDGVVLAEPLAGILSPDLAKEFSHNYVKEIVDELQDENFIIIYHNCGNNVIKMTDDLWELGCPIYHFGNSINIGEILCKAPDDVIVMGNIDPVLIKNGTKDNVIKETKNLLNQFGDKENYIISSGCDIPPTSSWDNINSFINEANKYYQNK